MNKLLSFLGATIGGYAGWALGALAGTFAAILMSFVGTGIGMYFGVKIAKEYLA